MDALEFLNDPEPETLTPPPAATLAAPRAAAVSKSVPIHQPTADDTNRALQAALDREMARRRWSRAEQIKIELEGRRQELEWHKLQSWSRQLLSVARGQQALLKGEIQRLEVAHRQALAREAGLTKALQADPIAASLIAEVAETTAQQRADQKAAATKILADREAAAEAKREQAMARERQAQAEREQDNDDPKPRKKSGGAAPKPR